MAKLLVIEDNPHDQTLLLHGLAGHAVTLVGTLQEAVAAVEREAWNLILLDLGLPDAPAGWGAWRAIVEKSGHIPLLIVTGGLREPPPLATIAVIGKERLYGNLQGLPALVTRMLSQPAVEEARHGTP